MQDNALINNGPDLILGVQLVDEQRLHYHLRHQGTSQRFEQKLTKDPYRHLHAFFTEFESLFASKNTTDEQRTRLLLEVEGFGATLGEHLLPKKLNQRLLSHVDPTRSEDEDAPSLWILSDELWIPWEALRLQGAKRQGPFLAELFALSRWFWNLETPQTLPLRQIGLLVSTGGPKLPETDDEREMVRELASEGTCDVEKVEPIEPRLTHVLDHLSANRFNALHFIGHDKVQAETSDLWGVLLNKDGETLKASDLRTPGCDLGPSRPFVFLNACRTAQGNLTLSSMGGLTQAFAQAGAGALVGTHWSIDDQRASDFARAFYQFFCKEGEPIAEAARQARLWLRENFPGDPSWLAYTTFGHPLARVNGPEGLTPPQRRLSKYLDLPEVEWNPKQSPPGALLRADHGIVPFHHRVKELEELLSWCGDEKEIKVRLYTGPGGMGKTRLSLELCKRMREEGWRTGFVRHAADSLPEEAVTDLLASAGPLLAVVDYAETRRSFLVRFLRALLEAQDDGPFRVILISRWREDWWEQLKMERDGVGDLIAGPATTHNALGPLALSNDDRAETYTQACAAFAKQLSKPLPEGLPEDLDAPYFKPVLMLHMSALGAVEGVPLKGEDGILDWVLDRERRFWRDQLEERKLPVNLMSGVGRTMSAITLAGGVLDQNGAVRLLKSLKFFKGQAYANLTNVARLMNDTYPGEDRWIMPVLPDILGEHLIERELVDDPQEIFDLILGPRNTEAAAEEGREEA